MAMDKKESRGLRTLLHVANLAPNALVSFLKDLIDPSSKH